MRHLLVSTSPSRFRRWGETFPEASRVSSVDDLDAAQPPDLLWLDLTTGTLEEKAQAVGIASTRGPAVAMVAVPDETEAFHLMRAGASGYCHLQAAPRQLLEIARVTAAGGLWMPPGVVQRITALGRRLENAAGEPLNTLEELSEREGAVARYVAAGASNREIAEALSISERTVKAHLSAVFAKLGVRDRVQLALVVHGLPVAGIVN